MNPLVSRTAWLAAPVFAIVGLAFIVLSWCACDPLEYMSWFSIPGRSVAAPVEWMTLALFGLIVPLVWLCPPNSGDVRRQCVWSFLWSVLGVMAIIRETDLHKAVFAWIWPEVVASFPGTVFKMPFLLSGAVPLASKLFVAMVFAAFFAAVGIPLVRYGVALARGVFRFEPVAWSAATFGAVSAFVLLIDRLPATLRDWGFVNLKAPGHEAGLALCRGLEEGAEMMMALLALLALLQSYLFFVHGKGRD